MNREIRDSLAQVVALLDRATPGPLEDAGVNEDGEHCIYGSDLSAVAVTIPSGRPDIKPERTTANADAIIAAVNFLREHGPALLAVVEGREDG